MPPKDRAIHREQRLKEQLAATKRVLAQVQAQNRAQARKDLARRRQHVGALAEAAGLLAWDDTTLAGLFQMLARLHGRRHPVAVLGAMLADERAMDALESVNGMAHLMDRVTQEE